MLENLNKIIRNSVLNNVNIGNGNTIIGGSNTNITSINGTTYLNGVNLNEKLGISHINSINCSNGKVIINGKDYTKEVFSDGKSDKPNNDCVFSGNITIEIHGDCGDIHTTGNVNVYDGNCGDIDTNGSVSVGGSVRGDIDTNGSVTVGGSVTGDIDANGRVTIGSR